jgi:two-component system, cell cycle sensor histidine kinase and response regulator CckA
MASFTLSSLRVRLSLVVLFAIIPAIVLTLYTGYRWRQLEISALRRNAARLALLSKHEQEQLVVGALETLTALSHMQEIREGNSKAWDACLRRLLKQYPHYANFGIVDLQGNVLSSAIPLEGPVSLKERLWFKRTVQLKRFSVGNYQIGKITNKPTLNFGYPLTDAHGNLKGVLFAALTLDYVNDVIARIPSREEPPYSGAAVTLLDAQYRILARYPDPQKWVGHEFPKSVITEIQHMQGKIEALGIDATPRYYTYMNLSYMNLSSPGSQNLKLIVGLPASTAFMPLNRVIYSHIFGLTLVGALALGATWVGGNMFLVRPVHRLLDAIQKLSRGDLSARSNLPHTKDELGQLARGLDEMASKIETQQLETRKSDKALRESEERYRRFFEEDLTGDFISTASGKLLACNPAFLRIFGFHSLEDAMNCPLDTLYPNAQARAELLQLLKEKKKLEYYETDFIRRDGKVIHVVENLMASFDNNGELTEIRGYIFDNTERKNLEEQFRQSQKMEAVGRLAGGMAHDFNNLLTVTIAYSGLLLNRLPETSPIRKGLLEIKRAGERAASLTRQLLVFSRKQVLQPQPLDLNAVVADMEKMLRRLIGEDIELSTHYEPNLARIRADSGQMEQVVMNLVLNARDAVTQGGTIILETKNVELDTQYAEQHVGVQPGHYVRLSVKDNGHGISREHINQIFEPFFTTKDKSKGTGLGLSTVYGIVKQSGGHISVHSKVLEGSTFNIYLPQTTEANEVQSPQENGGFTISGGTETVLVVDDDESVRKLTCEMLQELGYKTLVAETCHDALKQAQEHKQSLHLLITDVVMPLMNGKELAEKILSSNPETKVIFMSGYTGETILRNGIFSSEVAFLQKPFTVDSLAAKVRDVLDAKPVHP